MTSAIPNIQLNIRFEASDDTSTGNMRIQLGQTDIVLPLPAGLRFESTKPLHMSPAIPHPVNQETDYARISTSSTASNEAAPAETAKDKAFKKQLLLPSPASSKVSSKYQTQWPVIGGEDLILDTSAILSSAAFSANFDAGIIRDIYIAGCPGLKHLKGQLSIPIFKVGECAQDRIADRIKQQSKDQYGSYYKINGDWPVQDEGYDEYSALQIYIPETLHENSPVRALTRGLRVTLPKGMSRQQFSNRFQRKLSSCSWIEWRKTEDAIAHFERKNINQDIIDRYTDYGTGEKCDISQATELYCIRNENAQDCKRLIAVIENVILEQMGLI